MLFDNSLEYLSNGISKNTFFKNIALHIPEVFSDSSNVHGLVLTLVSGGISLKFESKSKYRHSYSLILWSVPACVISLL